MNLLTVFSRFPDQQACIEHLESIRWGDEPRCPYCDSRDVQRKRERQRVGRWNCAGCQSSFNVLAKTIFAKTRVPLRKWFLAISLTVNAKKSLSSHQLARDLDLRQQMAWYLMQRIRRSMAQRQSRLVLRGVLEADESYVGGKPRGPNKRHARVNAKRGRGTAKQLIAGGVERHGRLRLFQPPNYTGSTVGQMMRHVIEPAGSVLMTDELGAYRALDGWITHRVIRHRQQYMQGPIHTNNIESAWAVLKRAHHGSHHHYSVKWTPLYLAEAGWKWNERGRRSEESFDRFLCDCMEL